MDNLTMLSLIVGFFSPIIVDVIKQPNFTKEARTIVMILVSVVLGFATSYFEGSFNPADIVGSILVITVASTTAYKRVFEPLGISTTVENATSLTKAPEASQSTSEPQTRAAYRASKGIKL